ncbi:MAG: RNase adapter RapZ, partial [Steroidobacteraceae bacterium]
MRLIIVSGLSGSGKSVALHLLEDIDFYCVDNIPAALLKPFISHTVRGTDEVYPRTAVGLDARNRPNEIETIPALVEELRGSGISCEVLYLHANDEVLLKRYAETRRKHPLVSAQVSLREAIASERKLLEPITIAADLVIDTSAMGVHALRERIRERIDRRRDGRLALMFESFGYKHGIPGDADFVFDVRSLPNPYWEPQLRHLTGCDPAVIEYLAGQRSVR